MTSQPDGAFSTRKIINFIYETYSPGHVQVIFSWPRPFHGHTSSPPNLAGLHSLFLDVVQLVPAAMAPIGIDQLCQLSQLLSSGEKKKIMRS